MEPAEYDVMAQLEDSYWWYRGLRGMVCRTLRSLNVSGGPLTVLDAGCGTGGGMAAISRVVPSGMVVGVDLSSNALGHAARRRHHGSIVQGSVTQLPFRTGTFDVVLSLDVLCCREVEETTALREAHRVLRPGGWLIVNVPAFKSLRGAHDEAVHIRHRYRQRELQQLLTRQGFRVQRLTYWNALFFPLIFLFRHLRRPSSTRCAVAPRSDLQPLPRGLNWLLERLLAVETRVCRILRFPFGTSVFATACKAPS